MDSRAPRQGSRYCHVPARPVARPAGDRGNRVSLCRGKFYADRIRQCITGIRNNRAVGELHIDTPAIIEDAAGIVVQRKGAWCAIPAPHVLGIEDAYYGDEEEWSAAICDAYRTIMRTMRDTGVAGHVLIADRMDDAELASLAGQKIFFFAPAPDRENLAILMEYQQQVAVGKRPAEYAFRSHE